VICHCRNKEQAARLKDAIEQRFTTCFLTLHPQKTKIAYCKDDRRHSTYPTLQFDFLGYTFRPRRVSKDGQAFVGFNPGISMKSATAIRQMMRDWRLHLRSDLSLDQIARRVNPSLRGWINYYGAYYRSVLSGVLAHLDHVLARWAMRKYKSFKRRRWNALRWVRGVAWRQPDLFVHWATFG
jgi:RNA-directed DNA polymerase